jgi:esterase/lipase
MLTELNLPSWVGTAPAWALILLCIGTLIKTWPIIQKNLLEAKEKRESRMGNRITELERMVRECQQECEDHKEELREEIRRLENQRLNDRHQNLQEQISLVSILVRNVDNPILAQVLEQLQRTKTALPHTLTGVVGDAKTDL